MTSPPARRRAPRGTLNRARIVDAAIAVIDREGVEGISMPKLARSLGVGVMSLYSHVDSKDDLLDATVQRVLDGLPAPEGEAWRERIESHFEALRAALVAHPGIGSVLAAKNVATGAVLDLLEQNLADLTGNGVRDEESVHLYFTLLTYTLGFVAWELPRARALTPTGYAERWRAAVDSVDRDSHPTLHRLVDTLTSVATEEQYRDGLRRILDSAGPTRP